MRAETRHSLKTDRFSQATIGAAERTAHWSSEHRNTLIIAGVVLAVVAAAVAGGMYYLNQQDQKASLEVTRAVRTLDTPVRPANMPPQPEQPSFASSSERAAAAQKLFQGVVDNYPHTHAAEVSRYFLGVTATQLGDNAGAENNLKTVISSGGADLSALAKMALATVYRNSNRNKDAIELYKQLAAKPVPSVGKTVAEMELASTYEVDNQPSEAKHIYEQIQKENPTSEAAQMASAKLQQLK